MNAPDKIEAMGNEQWKLFLARVNFECRKRKRRIISTWTMNQTKTADYFRKRTRTPETNSQPAIMLEMLEGTE